jgi:glycosyltransferase involved in cell wall biosynthesis
VRVVNDARPAVDPRRTGVGHYADALVRHLPAADPSSRFVAWYLDVRGIGGKPRRFAGVAPNLSEHASRIPTRVFGPVSTRVGLPRVEWLAGESDLVIATNFLPPATGHPERAVLVVHDVGWVAMPESAPHHDERWRRRFASALGTCAGVLVPSQAVRDELLATHDVLPGLVDVVHHGTDVEAFQPAPPLEVEEIRRRFGIDAGYVLFLGGLEPRKNLEALIRAFGMVQDERVSLVVAGGAVNWAPEYAARVDRAIDELPPVARSRVVRTGYVTDEDRRALLSGAELLAYPSIVEGFGFPILEGFAANVPVLTSNVSSMPEVAGDAALLVDPMDPTSIAKGLDQLLGDEDLRNVMRAAGTARVAKFTWERSARETSEALRRAHDRTPG